MSDYKISFKELRQEPEISEMLEALERGLKKFGIDFFLVGAVARDVWMTAINNFAPSRITRDIDFGVYINENGSYNALREYLIDVEGFSPYKGNDFVLVWKGGVQVDLLPFGAIEQDGVEIHGTDAGSISLPGFKEIYDYGLPEAELEGKHLFKFCTLPGIVLLKLMSYEDRPEVRRDDIKDISMVITRFFNMYSSQIYENHSDLFGSDANLVKIGTRVIGREIGKIAKVNPDLFSRVDNLLEQNTTNFSSSEIAKIMAEYFDNTVAENMALLQELRKGLLEV